MKYLKLKINAKCSIFLLKVGSQISENYTTLFNTETNKIINCET